MQSIKAKASQSNLRLQIFVMQKKILVLLPCLCFILAIVPLSQQGCSISTHKDLHDINLFGTVEGNCSGKRLTIHIENEYRAYCTGSCASFHYAYVSPGKLRIRNCVPLPNSDGVYKVVRHTNFNATCDNGAKWELINFEYVNATTCKCRRVLDKYI
uniref:CTCK domain-containing protein n=1 Tax=Amphimedon queenslandica TaxID=400682 RepID=A0A1X7VDE1_AMPQE